MLSTTIECYWLLEGQSTPPSGQPERILPDGCIELIVNLSDRFLEHRDDDGVAVQPSRFVAGQMTRPVLVVPTGRIRVFGIRFVPGGTIPYFDGPASELTNLIVALDDAASDLSRAFASRLDPVGLPAELVAQTEAILLEAGRQRDHRGNSVEAAIARVLDSGGRTSVDRIASDLGISGRQLERRFVNEVGLGPKLLCRILRFQQVFRAVESDAIHWASLAAECGYFDQSHLIRDFRQFAGQTPAVLFEAFSPFGEFFTRKHRASGSSNTSLAT